MTESYRRTEALQLLESLIIELSSEIDLFYEDEDLAAARPAMRKMTRAARLLNISGRDTPPIFKHLQKRFAESRQSEGLKLSQ
ncbi:hypothetical protein GCM10023174_22940 [Chelativorans composti]|uniref:Uncharacterized protein n=1 Tax=Chelativorans composti TaxID=768533 RepID=A0ABW5DJA2_9HYPH